MKDSFNLYSDSYYDSLNGTFQNASSLNSSYKTYGSLSTCIRACLVLLLRAGFVLIQLGSIPVENVYVILLHNIVDIAVSIASFGLVGYIFAFGKDLMDGLIGHGVWINSDSIDLDNILFGFSGCLIANAIITSMLAGRVHFVGYLLICVLFSMFFQPIIMHWVWHDSGWMRNRYFLDHKVSVKDHAGGLTVHTTAGTVGFIGSLFLGRRLLMLSEIHESSIGPESPGSTMTGYTFIALGLIGFSLPTLGYELLHEPHNYIGIVLINNIMAMAAGIIISVKLHFLFYHHTFNYWIILRCMQCAIAGIVVVSPGVDVYTPIIAFAISYATGVFVYFITICIHNTALEDYCNVTVIHLICGMLGTCLPPILGVTENLGSSVNSHTRIIHLGWQLICLAIITGVMIVICAVLFLFLLLSGFLRNKFEDLNHERGAITANTGPDRCYLQRLFTVYSATPCIEPGASGKSASQFHSHQHQEGKEYLVNSPQFISNSRRSLTRPSKPPDPYLDKKINKHNSSITQSLSVANRSRFVFTVPNVKVFEQLENNMECPDAHCGGDVHQSHELKKYFEEQSRRDCDVEKTGVNLNGVIKRNPSFHKLHRTKKCTDLSNKGLKRKREFKSLNDINTSVFPQTFENMLYDSIFNDDFVTLKMPKGASFSNLPGISDC